MEMRFAMVFSVAEIITTILVTPGDKAMGWFGPGKVEAWRQLSQEIGAEFVKVGSGQGARCRFTSVPVS
jgi:hypothetical protein